MIGLLLHLLLLAYVVVQFSVIGFHLLTVYRTIHIDFFLFTLDRGVGDILHHCGVDDLTEDQTVRVVQGELALPLLDAIIQIEELIGTLNVKMGVLTSFK